MSPLDSGNWGRGTPPMSATAVRSRVRTNLEGSASSRNTTLVAPFAGTVRVGTDGVSVMPGSATEVATVRSNVTGDPPWLTTCTERSRESGPDSSWRPKEMETSPSELSALATTEVAAAASTWSRPAPARDLGYRCPAASWRMTVVPINAALMSSTGQVGCACFSRAAAPETCGADIDVPL